MDMKIYVDTDSDVCLARRLRRDIAERALPADPDPDDPASRR